MELSGALAADTNTVNGTVVKYSEPTEARKPKKKWRLYVFKVINDYLIIYKYSLLISTEPQLSWHFHYAFIK